MCAQLWVPAASPIRPPRCRRLPGPAPARPPVPGCARTRQAAGIGDRRPERAEPPPAPPAPAWGAPALPLRAGPCWACSMRRREPGSLGARIGSPCFLCGRGGAKEAGGAGRQSAPCSAPPPSRAAAAPQDAGQSGAGGGSSAVTPSLRAYWELYQEIQFRERRGRRREGQRRSGRGKASQTGRSAPESLKPERDKQPIRNFSGRCHPGEQPKNHHHPNSDVSYKKLET